jgi:2-polyprenyl-3-methyl-5-hydroxy-6-metoxy-1,4-benzoquinol methylase
MSLFQCHACGGEVPVLEAPALAFLVGSDCTPALGKVRVGACSTCGLMQKEISPEWQRLCDEIYSNYQIYHQAAGSEQKARSAGGGALGPRSDLIAAYLGKTSDLPADGSVLDIGCGNGAFLRAMNKAFANWSVTGSDLNDSFRAEICAISRRASFLNSEELAKGERQFDVVSFIHCIEHIPAPVQYLAEARRYIRPEGFLLIQVPDAELNPFDLVVADHSSHLAKTTLKAIVESAGYDVVACGNLVVGKEITLLARPRHGRPVGAMHAADPNAQMVAQHNLAWLDATMRCARKCAREHRPFGIFGTSIAGVWIASALDYKVDFYVDEDEVRIGRDYFGAPIIAADAVPAGGTVFVCLEPKLAAAIIARHQSEGRRYLPPPPLDAG